MTCIDTWFWYICNTSYIMYILQYLFVDDIKFFIYTSVKCLFIHIMIVFNPIDGAWFLLSKRDSAVSRLWFATRIGWRNADFEHQAGMDSDLCICSCFTFVHPMILRRLGQWNGIWSWTKSYEIIWNHLKSYKVNALNLRTLPNVAAGYARSVPVPMLHIGKTVNKTVASWASSTTSMTTSSRLLDVDLQLCNVAFGLTRWARSDQMGPNGTRDRPWQPWGAAKDDPKSATLQKNRII